MAMGFPLNTRISLIHRECLPCPIVISSVTLACFDIVQCKVKTTQEHN